MSQVYQEIRAPLISSKTEQLPASTVEKRFNFTVHSSYEEDNNPMLQIYIHSICCVDQACATSINWQHVPPTVFSLLKVPFDAKVLVEKAHGCRGCDKYQLWVKYFWAPFDPATGQTHFEVASYKAPTPAKPCSLQCSVVYTVQCSAKVG